MEYRCVATTLEGFIQQLAVCYVGRGYYYYVLGRVPEGKDPAAVDRKLIERYGITAKKWERAYRKQQGLANLQYLRYGRTFVLLCSEGEHVFRSRERASIRDVRKTGIRFGGYLVSFRGGHVQVRIDPVAYRQLRGYYVDLACHRSRDALIQEFYRAPFEPYAPIRRQMFCILREVNRRRKQAGFELVPTSAIWLKRRIVKPFAEGRCNNGFQTMAPPAHRDPHDPPQIVGHVATDMPSGRTRALEVYGGSGKV